MSYLTKSLERYQEHRESHDEVVGDVTDHIIESFLEILGVVDLLNKVINLEDREELMRGYGDMLDDVLAGEGVELEDVPIAKARTYLWVLVDTELE